MRRSEAFAFRHKIESAAEMQTDEQALESIELFPAWNDDMDAVRDKRYKHNGKLWRCLQSHHTQADWEPGVAPSLWTVVSLDEWPEWVQPTSAADAYNTGDKVTFEGEHYICLIDGNTWSPAEYPAGWAKQ